MEQNSLELIFITDEIEGRLSIEDLKKCNQANKIILFDNNAKVSDFIPRIFDHNDATYTHLILLDLPLSRADWPEVIDELNSFTHTQNIYVLILISSKEEREMLKQYEQKVAGYLLVPPDINEFNSTLVKLRFSCFF